MAVEVLLRLPPHLWYSVCGDVIVSVRVWLLGYNCLCPVTPQGGVLWHAVGQFPASTAVHSLGAMELHRKLAVSRE